MHTNANCLRQDLLKGIANGADLSEELSDACLRRVRVFAHLRAVFCLFERHRALVLRWQVICSCREGKNFCLTLTSLMDKNLRTWGNSWLWLVITFEDRWIKTTWWIFLIHVRIINASLHAEVRGSIVRLVRCDYFNFGAWSQWWLWSGILWQTSSSNRTVWKSLKRTFSKTQWSDDFQLYDALLSTKIQATMVFLEEQDATKCSSGNESKER